jgi:hypothetical protein
LEKIRRGADFSGLFEEARPGVIFAGRKTPEIDASYSNAR